MQEEKIKGNPLKLWLRVLMGMGLLTTAVLLFQFFPAWRLLAGILLLAGFFGILIQVYLIQTLGPALVLKQQELFVPKAPPALRKIAWKEIRAVLLEKLPNGTLVIGIYLHNGQQLDIPEDWVNADMKNLQQRLEERVSLYTPSVN